MRDARWAMVLASFAGDSLALGPHWIYDPEKIAREFGRLEDLAAPLPDSFHKSRGRGEFTHYGDQTLVLLESLAGCGRFDLDDFARRWRELFDGYDGYLDGATKTTLSNFKNGWGPEDSGSPSTDLAGASRIAPLVSLLSGDEEALVAACREQTRMTHRSSGVADAAEFFAVAALKILGGMPPAQALEEAAKRDYLGAPLAEWAGRGLESAGKDTEKAIDRFGRSCHLDGAFPGVVHLVAKYAGNPAEALRQSALAGGDSAARNLLAGMLLAADPSAAPLPEKWLAGLKARERIETLLGELDRQ